MNNVTRVIKTALIMAKRVKPVHSIKNKYLYPEAIRNRKLAKWSDMCEAKIR